MRFNFSISSSSSGYSRQFSVNYKTNRKHKDHQHCCDSNFNTISTNKTTAKCSLLSSHRRCTEASFNVLISRNHVPELKARRLTLFLCAFSVLPSRRCRGQVFSTAAGRTAPRGQLLANQSGSRARAGARGQGGNKKHLPPRAQRAAQTSRSSRGGPRPDPRRSGCHIVRREISVGGLQPGCRAQELLRSTFFQPFLFFFFFFCQQPAVPG